jgi:hypothetical protein
LPLLLLLLLLLLQAVLGQSMPPQQMHQVLDTLLQRDLQPLLQFNIAQQGTQQQQLQLGEEGAQFVAGRALWTGAKLREVATAQQREMLLRAAATAGGPMSVPSTVCDKTNGIMRYISTGLGQNQAEYLT